ncbi:MAG: hypothetical protein HN348_00850, partial [Proteobacteria bacterium]|nr:hypothetical protein [Pseudomonadota bacterium]
MVWLVFGAILVSETFAATCPTGKIENCNGKCVWEQRLGNGTCNKGLSCLELQMDYGDCSCPAGEVFNCNGRCIPERRLGNGVCNSRLACEATDWDMGDCSNTNSAPYLTNPGPQTNWEGDVVSLSMTPMDFDGDPLYITASNLPDGLS